MLDKILEIGKEIQDKGFSSLVCRDTIDKIDITSDLDTFNQELSKWILSNELPTQLNVYNTFGQPPVTVFNNGEFVVDLYFWMHADTSLHSHAFEGAFKVLYGQSLHEEFSIELQEKYSDDVVLNKLNLDTSAILNPGDSNIITSGDSFNHRVIHLSSPTVTLCVRTVKDLTVPQWHYFDNGLSILKRELDESVYKKMFFADYLCNSNIKTATQFTHKFLKSLELSQIMNLFEQLTVDTMGLSEDYQAILYENMMAKLSSTKWFSLYEDVCDQELSQAEDNSEQARLIAHLNNYSYSEEDAVKLFNQLI